MPKQKQSIVASRFSYFIDKNVSVKMRSEGDSDRSEFTAIYRSVSPAGRAYFFEFEDEANGRTIVQTDNVLVMKLV